jgi:hypothetical protein
MTGHFVARSVRAESDGKRGEAADERERKVVVVVFPKNGHDFLKRVRDDSLSIGGELE